MTLERLSRIHTLSPELVAQIAAGEVIERPASVVKELLENAIDAGARHVRVELEVGGMRLIRIVDDGEGMAPDDLPLAFAPHATSKLTTSDALETVETLGFRGEALHSIAAVARVEAHSSRRHSGVGGRIVLEDGRVVDHVPAPAVGGTRISVWDLFGSVPARRKFLRSERAETAAVYGVIVQYALGHPSVAFTLEVDGKQSFSAPGTGSMEDAWAAAYGASLLDRMVPVKGDGRVAVSGLSSSPQLTRSNRSAIVFIVNGRPVRSRPLTYALEEAYSGLLMVGRHCMAALHISLPPSDVDCNVHPAKLEVRFVHEREVLARVHEAARAALADRSLTPVATFDPSSIPPSSTAASAAFDLSSPSTEPVMKQGSLLSDDVGDRPPVIEEALPALRVLGQSAQTFIVAEGPEGLYMIDQHAAHERVLFDRLSSRSTGELESQPLLEPIVLELSSAQMEILEAEGSAFAGLGFTVEPFGDRACLVRGVPAAASGVPPAQLVLEVLDGLPTSSLMGNTWARGLAVVACKAAVKAGDTLSLEEMRSLVRQLEATERPRTCPHGRPTVLHLSTQRLEREFGRT